MEKHSVYGEYFYEQNLIKQSRSAVGIVSAIKHYISPHSVIDIGCGTGGMLSEWSAQGISDITGVDGDYVFRDLLMIPNDKFVPHDLTKPFHASRRYDLAMCFEVAEHLKESFSGQLIDLLTDLSNVVVFSAAIPGQTGDSHINEQYQSYWANLFELHGYTAIDCIRPKIWDDEQVAFFYKQNILMYVNKDSLHKYPALSAYESSHTEIMTDIVHPLCWDRAIPMLIWVKMGSQQYATEKLAKVQRSAKGRRIVCWGTGFNANNIKFYFSQNNFAPDMLFVDAKKESSSIEYMPTVPLEQLKNASGHYYIVISPFIHFPEIEEKLKEFGYNAEDYCWFADC